MKFESVLCGNRESFAIECHLKFITDTAGKNLAGFLWFWVGGDPVGNRDVISLPGMVANELRQTLRWCGHRSDSNLYVESATAVLDAVRRGLYDTSGPATEDAQWERFLICMLPGGHEFMDGWLTVMIEDPRKVDKPGDDRILYRRTQPRYDKEVWLRRGEYKATVQKFLAWFETSDKSFKDGQTGTDSVNLEKTTDLIW